MNSKIDDVTHKIKYFMQKQRDKRRVNAVRTNIYSYKIYR